MRYIHQLDIWPKFIWDHEKVTALLGPVRNRQGRFVGRMEAMGFALRTEALLETLTLDVLKSSEIEGEVLNADQVRSSIARRLGLDIAGLVPSDRDVDGVVERPLGHGRVGSLVLHQQHVVGIFAGGSRQVIQIIGQAPVAGARGNLGEVNCCAAIEDIKATQLLGSHLTHRPASPIDKTLQLLPRGLVARNETAHTRPALQFLTR